MLNRKLNCSVMKKEVIDWIESVCVCVSARVSDWVRMKRVRGEKRDRGETDRDSGGQALKNDYSSCSVTAAPNWSIAPLSLCPLLRPSNSPIHLCVTGLLVPEYMSRVERGEFPLLTYEVVRPYYSPTQSHIRLLNTDYIPLQPNCTLLLQKNLHVIHF